MTKAICVVFALVILALGASLDASWGMTLMEIDSTLTNGVTIAKIISGKVPDGTRISIDGRFLGWHGCKDSSFMLTRSDWAIEDATGCMMVTGALPKGLRPYMKKDALIHVEGTVRMVEGRGAIIQALDVRLKRRAPH